MRIKFVVHHDSREECVFKAMQMGKNLNFLVKLLLIDMNGRVPYTMKTLCKPISLFLLRDPLFKVLEKSCRHVI